MALNNKQKKLASKIEKWVKGIHDKGGGMEDMLVTMYDYMPTFKQLMEMSGPDEMDMLCEQYPGFYQFALLLENLARGISDGTIEVPED